MDEIKDRVWDAQLNRFEPKKKKKNRGRRPAVTISPAQIIFAAEYVSNGGHGEPAAEKAGYKRSTACTLLQSPFVRAEIERVKEHLRVKTGYTVEAAFEQSQRLLHEAERAGQFMAAAKFADLSMRLHGLLIEKQLSMTTTIDLHAVLEKAKPVSPEMNQALIKFLAGWKKGPVPLPDVFDVPSQQTQED